MRIRIPWLVSTAAICFLLALVPACSKKDGAQQSTDSFTQLMTRGNGFLEGGDLTNAVAAYLQATTLVPESLDARLNLANAYLLAGDASNAVTHSQHALDLDDNSAAAYYVMGCAFLRLNQPEPAVKALQQSQQIDPAVTALNFQLGLAHEKLGQNEAGIAQFEAVVKFEPQHPSVHYQLSRLYERVGRSADAAQEMQKHQQVQAKLAGVPTSPATFEKSKHTAPRTVFTLEQPEPNGVPVRFVDATAGAFSSASNYHGPMAVVDFNHDGRNSLFVCEGEKDFRLLNNVGGRFEAMGEALPGKPGGNYRRALVGDLNNDRVEDVVVIGESASHVFKIGTNGSVREVSAMTGLKALQGRDGVLADLDFTGKLDLLTVLPGGGGLRLYRNLGNSFFQDKTADSGLPAALAGAEQVAVEDWSNDDVPGIFVAQAGKPPGFFAKQRAGKFTLAVSSNTWPAGAALATGDLNNDLRADFVVAGETGLGIVFAGNKPGLKLVLQGLRANAILLTDYDNDGWLDVFAYGNGLRVWRNRGSAGFTDTTAALGLDKLSSVDSIVVADFDADGDTDLVLSTSSGLQFRRNDGGNANQQLKLRLVGNRSNASALGVRVEVAAGNWRTIRTLQQLPLEIGVGKRDKLDAVKVRWFDLSSSLVDVTMQTNVLTLDELTLPSGSCPYLYVWDGEQFRFVTDILGAAPLGLPVSKTRYIEADPEELLALGGEEQFKPRDGAYEIRLTEELREVLYLDEASLVIVDHPADTVVLPTSKLHPGKPFPPHELWTLRRVAELNKATRSDDLDVTAALVKTDQQMVSPVRLREAQLRGLAEPYSVTMDFGALQTDRPLVLALNGWLRFGGGMANIGASLDAELPFPFPTLEAKLPDGSWKKLDVTVGAPCGKTKTILVDLEKSLSTIHHQQSTNLRLRLTTAFEIHWDSAALCEKVSAAQNNQVQLTADRTDLRWRGFSEFQNLPDSLPLSPDYTRLRTAAPWRRTPSGWCTRYGEVNELIQKSDDALALLNGGDELALSFRADKLPPTPAGFVRSFFLHVVGWDKDADFHVGQGWRVEPLPYRGMDDQNYDQVIRPETINDEWIKRYNTRWVGPRVLGKNRE